MKNSTRVQLNLVSVGSNPTGSHLPTCFSHSFIGYLNFTRLFDWPNRRPDVGPVLCPPVSPIIRQVDSMVRETFREEEHRRKGTADDAKPSKPPLESEASHPIENVAVSPLSTGRLRERRRSQCFLSLWILGSAGLPSGFSAPAHRRFVRRY
ncbi:hypothetical protein BHM03_00011745 [Ensete ventricosum]|nr:hypothetical protein BHM03_00011745 [Ensete ventricosum]